MESCVPGPLCPVSNAWRSAAMTPKVYLVIMCSVLLSQDSDHGARELPTGSALSHSLSLTWDLFNFQRGKRFCPQAPPTYTLALRDHKGSTDHTAESSRELFLRTSTPVAASLPCIPSLNCIRVGGLLVPRISTGDD